MARDGFERTAARLIELAETVERDAALTRALTPGARSPLAVPIGARPRQAHGIQHALVGQPSANVAPRLSGRPSRIAAHNSCISATTETFQMPAPTPGRPAFGSVSVIS